MSKYIFLLLLFNSIFCLEYKHLTKNVPMEIYFDENPIQGVYLEQSDLVETDDLVEGNDLYFLRINQDLKVNCIIQNEEPDDESFNKDTSTDISEICQSSIELEDNFKLMPFPKKLAEGEKIFFIFFVEDNEPEGYLRASTYTVKRVSFPKPLEVKDEPYEIKISGEDAAIYLLKKEPENYNILSSLGEFPISIFGYKDKKFEKLGRIEKDNYIFQLNENLELDNGFAYVIFDNEKESEETVQFSFNFKIQLFTVNIDETPEKFLNYTDFETNLVFLQIINKDKKLLKINFDYDYLIRVLDEDYKKVDKILDESFYKYIPQNYVYTKGYELFLVFPGFGKKGIFIENYDLTETPTEIEMNKFVYFKISKDEEVTFKVNYPTNNIILKLISDNTGSVDISETTYSFSFENNIYIINNKEEELTIKGVENDLILAIKSEISDEFITYAKGEDDYPVSFESNEGFLAVNIDYQNHDYVSFYLRDKDFKRKYNRSIDFGFLTKNDYTFNELIESDSMAIYDLKYYKKNSNGRNLTRLYYINNITNTSNIQISTNYYTDFKLEYNQFHKISGKFITKIYKNYRLFLLTKSWGSALLECSTNFYGIFFDLQNNFDILDSYNCYGEFELEDGYIYAQPMEDDTEYNYNEYSLLSTVDLKVKNKTHINVSFRYNFTSLTKYNFTFILTEKKNERAFNTIISIFELFYLYNNYSRNQFEVYKFNLKDMQVDKNNIASIELKTPTLFNISNENQTFVYTLISESSPVKMFQIYDVKTYHKEKDDSSDKSSDEVPNTDDPEDDDEDDDDDGLPTYLIVIFVGIGVIVAAIIIFFILRFLRKKNSDAGLDSQINNNKEMTLPMTDA